MQGAYITEGNWQFQSMGGSTYVGQPAFFNKDLSEKLRIPQDLHQGGRQLLHRCRCLLNRHRLFLGSSLFLALAIFLLLCRLFLLRRLRGKVISASYFLLGGTSLCPNTDALAGPDTGIDRGGRGAVGLCTVIVWPRRLILLSRRCRRGLPVRCHGCVCLGGRVY